MPTLRQLRKATKDNPGDARGWYELGAALAAENKLDETREAMVRAVECKPATADLCLMIGLSLERLGHPDAAATAYRLGAERDPQNPEPETRLGILLFKRGRAGDALLPLLKAVILSSHAPEACVRYATALEKVERREEAVSYLHIAAHASPENLDAQRGLARMLRDYGHPSGAVRAMRRIVELAPGDHPAMTALATALSDMGDNDEAIRLLRLVAEAHPTSSEPMIDLGIAYSRSGHHEQALEVLSRAVAMTPESARGHLSLGVAFADAGEHEKSLGQFCDTIALAPRWPLAHLNLALAYRALKDPIAARDTLLKAASIAPEDEPIQAALREILIEIARGNSAPKEEESPPKEEHSMSASLPMSALSGTGSMGPDESSGAPHRPLSGELEAFPIPEILEFLRVSRASGVLDVHTKSARGLIRIDRGNITGSASPQASNVLKILVERRVVTDDDIEVALGGREERTSTLHALALVDDGVVPRSELETAIWTQVTQTLKEIVSWTHGRFTFHQVGESDSEDMFQTRISVDTRFALMEAMKELDEANR